MRLPRRCVLCRRWRSGYNFHHSSECAARQYADTAAWEDRLTASYAADYRLCDDCRNTYRSDTRDDGRIIKQCHELVARFFPPPTPALDTPAESKPEPKHLLTFGTTSGRSGRGNIPVTITETDRSRHIYLIGGTGSGKSVTLTNLAIQDIAAGRGFTVIDPHGDLVNNPDPERGGLLQRIPPDQFARVAYFDPTDADAPSFNLLAADFDPNKLTSDLVATFKMFFGESWGAQMEALLSYSLLTLLMDREHQTHTFTDLRTLLIDEAYRNAVVERASPELQSFWQYEYKAMTKDAARPILTRLGQMQLPGSPLRRVLTNPTNDLDVRAIMDEGKILLVNLSKGALGEQPARLLGGLIVTAITQAALARQSIPETKRTPHTLYCDEFQNFADLPSTESILSEARKYQLRLVLAHQTMAQVNSQLMASILGNVRTLVGFSVSPDDAAKLAKRMSRQRYRHKQTRQFLDLGATSEEQYDRRTAELARHVLEHVREVPNEAAYHNAVPGTHWRCSDADAWKELRTRLYEPHRRDTINPPLTTEYSHQTWPEPRDFQNLATCRAFIMRNTAETTCDLSVPFPPPVPYPDNLDRWHQKRGAERAANPPSTSSSSTAGHTQPLPSEPEDFAF
jgi:hypothetical protein